MSNTRSTSQESIVFPMIFLIGLMVVLAFLFAPQPVRSTLVLPPTATPESVVVVAAQPTPTMDTTNMDHLTLMALGLEEVNASSVKAGFRIFSTTCSACHGYDAKGIAGLGKPLIGSEFANSLSDDELVAFISVGRQATDPLNTTGQVMPARGGNPGLTDADLNNVVDYVRSLNGATVIEDVPQQTASTDTGFTAIDINAIDSNAVQASAGASGSADLTSLEPVEFTVPDINAIDPAVVHPSMQASGGLVFDTMTAQQAYNWSCSGCHGLDGRGNPLLNVGDLSQMSDDNGAVLEMLTQQPIEAGALFIHPVYGGYPHLTDEQLSAVLEYVRGLMQ